MLRNKKVKGREEGTDYGTLKNNFIKKRMPFIKRTYVLLYFVAFRFLTRSYIILIDLAPVVY